MSLIFRRLKSTTKKSNISFNMGLFGDSGDSSSSSSSSSSSASSLTSPDGEPAMTIEDLETHQQFGTLDLIKQAQIVSQLETKFQKSWHRLTLNEKQLAYYIGYGNWGVREKFSNWNQSSAPLDLPFIPNSKLQNTTKRLPEIELSKTPVREEQFKVKSLDAGTKIVVFMIILIVMFALHRDKYIGEQGKPEEIVIYDRYQLEREEQEKKQEEEEKEREMERNRLVEEKRAAEEKEKSRKKWYYLYLR